MFKKESIVVLSLFFICLFNQFAIADSLIKKKYTKKYKESYLKDSSGKSNTIGAHFSLFNFTRGIPTVGERYHSYNLFYLRKLNRFLDLGGSLFYGMEKDGLCDYNFYTNVYGLGIISRINAKICKSTLFFEQAVYYGDFRNVRWFNNVAVKDKYIKGSIIVNPSIGIGIPFSTKSTLEFKVQHSFYLSSKFNTSNVMQAYRTLSPSIGYTFKF